MSELLVQIVGSNLPSEEMPNGACVILTGDERAVAEAAKLWGKRVVLVRVERVAVVENAFRTMEETLARIKELAGLVAHDLQGRVESGKVAAVQQCAELARRALDDVNTVAAKGDTP
jgi:hypothetical protein